MDQVRIRAWAPYSAPKQRTGAHHSFPSSSTSSSLPTPTMIITFNPPLRETVHVASPSLIPQIQTTPLLFTAQLSALDHAQLVREGGRIQLWSDLPRHDKANGGWSELEFIDANEPKEPLSRAYTVSLRSSPRARDTQIKNLYLSIILPPTNSEAQQFSFTYRIVYPSGRTTWLSDFGQNGSLVLTVPEPNVLSGLVLQEPWAVDPSRQARIFHNGEGIDTLEVAKITRISDFRIQALGKDGFIPNLTNASVLFFVPRLHGNALAILPTYVMTASPGLTMSVSTEGRVTISGSGTVLLQSDVMQEAGPFIQQVLLHSTLDNWNILASDSKSKAVVLASSGPTYPIHAAVIPLWPSEDIQLPLGLDFSKLTAALASIEMQEFALFTSSKQQMHIFNLQQTEAQKVEKILLDFDSTTATLPWPPSTDCGCMTFQIRFTEIGEQQF
ncbi:hypothetical protein BDZ97DRAFT_1247203 [Flammula alnicola]|nr:hypothetical protein BDZ97DRAFT_1247203 [Flammula alnicola]